jgi:cation transport ATPase
MGTLDGEVTLFGNRKLLDLQRISISEYAQGQIESLQEQGKTVNFVARGHQLI